MRTSFGDFESSKELFALDGRRAIVTGSGGGIGGTIVFGLAEFGVDIALFGTNAGSMQNSRGEMVERFPVTGSAAPVDMCNAKQVEDALRNIRSGG